MKRWSWLLALLAAVVLTFTIALLVWLRERTAAALEAGVEAAQHSFDAQKILGDVKTRRVEFAAAETFVANARRNPQIRGVIVTKRLGPAGEERPIVPYHLYARLGADWKSAAEGMRRSPLEAGGAELGALYFDLDRSSVRSVTWAIAAASIALAAALALLIGRLYSRETSLVRVGSELEARKRELIRLERLALAGQLSAGLLHDLKKPVAHIRHGAEELKAALGDFGGASPALADIRAQAELFFRMLEDNQIERFVRSDRVAEEYVDINAALRSSLRLVQYERGSVEVAEDYAADLPPVLAQPFRLVQVFSNLIVNAYQAMKGAGRLAISTRPADGGAEITISDSGPGMTPELLASIFEPFFTTKPEAEGSGLGLAICRMIVEDLGGRITAESAPGSGAAFRVWLPCEAPGARAPG